jgi:hypothetical protein
MEKVAQARERVADRRLAEVKLLPGAGHAAFAVDRFENDEKVEIDLRKITHIDESIF